MRAPDGKGFGNRIVFLEIKRPELLVFDHGSDQGQRPAPLPCDDHVRRAEGQEDRRHDARAPSDEDAARCHDRLGAVELGYQTLDKLTEHLRSRT